MMVRGKRLNIEQRSILQKNQIFLHALRFIFAEKKKTYLPSLKKKKKLFTI